MSAKYSSIPTATPVSSVTMVEVVAPTDLSEGYIFDAVYDGTTFQVTVPKGGVKKGQRFQVPFNSNLTINETTPAFMGGGTTSTEPPPDGRWRDGLCDCLKFGPLHPHFLNAWCCPQILMGQVLTRMKMNWLGSSEVPDSEWRQTFKTILLLVIAYIVLNGIISPPGPYVDVTEDGDVIVVTPPAPQWQVITSNLLSVSFGLYTLIVLIRLRKAVRAKYAIPETVCVGWEDLCCSLWCGCCTVAQLARHTVDYQDRRAVCCSPTGLPTESPVFVV